MDVQSRLVVLPRDIASVDASLHIVLVHVVPVVYQTDRIYPTFDIVAFILGIQGRRYGFLDWDRLLQLNSQIGTVVSRRIGTASDENGCECHQNDGDGFGPQGVPPFGNGQRSFLLQRPSIQVNRERGRVKRPSICLEIRFTRQGMISVAPASLSGRVQKFNSQWLSFVIRDAVRTEIPD